MTYVITAQWGYAKPTGPTTWQTDIHADPIEIGKVEDVEEFHRIVEINMGDARVLASYDSPDSKSYIYRDEFGGSDPEYWWVEYKMEEHNV